MTVALLILGGIASLVCLWEAVSPPRRRLNPLLKATVSRVPLRASPSLATKVAYPMQRLEPGEFIMGTPPNVLPSQRAFSDELPPHPVIISNPLLVGRCPVTQGLWEAVMGQSLRSRYAEHSGRSKPIINITWFDAIRFCNELSAKQGLTFAYSFLDPMSTEPEVHWDRSSNGFRLPSEAEWEYFARAGTTTPYWSGSSADQLRASEWTGEDAAELPDVGKKLPNPWGLYDTNGLVGEWCWDWYGPYPSAPQTDPVGPPSGTGRVWRGGRWFWKERPEYFRSADRDQMLPVNSDRAVGLRVVTNLLDV